MKTIIKIALGIVVGFVLLAGGCAAIIGGAMSGSGTDSKTAAERATEDREERPKSFDSSEGPDASEESPKAKPTPSYTASQENAMAKAEDYLELTAMSRIGLIEQLVFEGFPLKDATFAVDRLKVNWNEQAAAKAEEYLKMSSFSRTGLIEQLEFEDFTTAQATYGVNQTGL